MDDRRRRVEYRFVALAGQLDDVDVALGHGHVHVQQDLVLFGNVDVDVHVAQLAALVRPLPEVEVPQRLLRQLQLVVLAADCAGVVDEHRRVVDPLADCLAVAEG